MKKTKFALIGLLLMMVGVLGACGAEARGQTCASDVSHGIGFIYRDTCFSCHTVEVPMPANHIVFNNTHYCLDCHKPGK